MKGKIWVLMVLCLLMTMAVVVINPTTAEENPPGWTDDIRLTAPAGGTVYRKIQPVHIG